MPIEIGRVSRRFRGGSVWLAIAIAGLGGVNAVLALVENPAADYAGFGVRNWVFLILLPFSIGVMAPLAIRCSRSLAEKDRKSVV